MLKEEKQEMYETLENLYGSSTFCGKDVIVFGSNEPAERMADWLLSHGICVEAMVDNNEKKHGTSYKGIFVKKPENVLGNMRENVIILIASKYYNEMVQQLETMGYKEGEHIYQVANMACWSTFSLTEETFLKKEEEICKGWEIYKKIRKKYDRETRIFICPFPALGDVYLAGRYLESYCVREKISSYVVTVASGACFEVLSLFGITQVEKLQKTESDCLVQSLIFCGLKECNAEILHQRFPYTVGIGGLGNYKELCFNDHFKYTIFGMEKSEKGKFPKKFSDSSYVDKFFSENSLVKGKTVIISPYANTSAKIPEDFWENIVKEYQDKGYIVCTNSSGEEEPAIKGTKAVIFPLSKAIKIVEAAGLFIGLRSGFCDVVSSAKAKKIIFYPDRVYQGGKFINFYSLKNMGLSEDVEERIVKNILHKNQFKDIEKLDKIFSNIDNGASYWKDFQEKYQICSKDIIIIMVSKREDFNYYTLHFLWALKKEKNADRIYILHSNNILSSYIETEASVHVHDILCNEEDIKNICQLAYIYKFSEQLYINDYNSVCDCDGSLLIDNINCTAADIVAISFLGLSGVPKEKDFMYTRKEHTVSISNYKRINWNVVDNAIKTGREYLITNSDMEQMIKERTFNLVQTGKIKKDNQIVLFGLTTASMLVKKYLEDYEIVAIVDNDKRKIGKNMDGIPVYTPEEYLSKYDNNKRIIIASQYYHSMCEQLYQYGYEVNREVFVVYFRYYFYDVLPGTIKHYKDVILSGKDIYEKITGKETNKDIIICPYPGTGDIYLAGIYLDEYARQNIIGEYIVVVCSGACLKIASLFGLNAKFVTDKEIWEMLVFARSCGLVNKNVHIINDGFNNGSPLVRLRGYKGIDLNTMFSKCVFKLKKKSGKINIKQNNSDALFEKYGLEKGKTVMLSPYANTINMIPEDFWERLSTILKESGYTVCTNVASDKEIAVRGTKGIFVPYEMIIDFLDKAGYFIGLRSGLCDIISSTKAKVFIFYPKGIHTGYGSFFDYFSLEHMGLRKDNLMETEYVLEEMDEVLETVTEKIFEY